MKRITMLTAILFFAASLFAQQNQLTGKITELAGTVELKPAGRAAFVPARNGDIVAADTIVSTGFKSSALISVGSIVLTIRPLTRLTLKEITSSAGTETINVSLQSGRVRVDVNPQAGTRASMNVQSPIATASVRGTSFEFDTERLTVLEGTVEFQGSQGGIMLVSGGSVSTIMENGRSADPIETFAAELVPQPPAGYDTGYKTPGLSDSDGNFGFGFVLH